MEEESIVDCKQYYLLCTLQATLLEERSIVHYSAHTTLLTVMQTVGGRECSNLTDNTISTALRISRGFKLGWRSR